MSVSWSRAEIHHAIAKVYNVSCRFRTSRLKSVYRSIYTARGDPQCPSSPASRSPAYGGPASIATSSAPVSTSRSPSARAARSIVHGATGTTRQSPASCVGWGSAPADILPLADARKLALDYRRIVRIERRDPVEERRASKASALKERASAMTFSEACDGFMNKHGDTFRNDKHRRQWRSTLNRACDVFGAIHVAQVETGHVLKCLTPIWSATPETGSRLRGRIERVLDFASAAGVREGPNPARWEGHLEHLLARKKPGKSHAAMPWSDVPEFMAELRKRTSLSARAAEFTILTAARTGETLGATWDEIDLQAKVWTIPGERMKAGKEHQVPLSDRVVEILAGMRDDGGRIFPLSNMAMLQMVRGLSPNGYTVHGFRSAFRDWAGERTNFPRDVIEFALAHSLPDKTERAYRRETAVGKRRKLMQTWATYCAMPNAPATLTLLARRA